MTEIRSWMKSYAEKAEELFPGRIRFIGLQGSYGRGEASENSDINVVLILDRLMEKIRREDVQRTVKIGACNIYHMCVHNMVHEKDAGILRGLYKSARFAVQAVLYLQTGRYEKQRSRMMPLLLRRERRIMENEAEIRRILDAGQCPDKEFARLSNELLTWASEWIQGRTFCLSPEKEEGLS